MPRRIREAAPIQVYLARDEQSRLGRLADELATTKSDVLRRGLLALEREVHDPESHPVLRMIGLVTGPLKRGPGYDVAIEHDRFLADSEVASWKKPRRQKPPKRAR